VQIGEHHRLLLSFSVRGTRRYRAFVDATRRQKFPPLRVKRVYDPPSEHDGVRVLVDRLGHAG